MIPYAPGSVLIVPCESGFRFHFQGPDPITLEEAAEVQRANGYAPDANPIRSFERIRTTRWWVTQWTCEIQKQDTHGRGGEGGPNES